MSWRTLVITRRCKLDLCLNYMEIRGEEVKKVHLSELHTVIIDSTAVSLTAALLCEMMRRKIKVIFCDEKRNPQSELIPYYGSHDTSARVRQQIGWDDHTRALVWAEIIAEKIRRQQALLRAHGQADRAVMLESYIHDVQAADASNREGLAAKVYFNGLFGPEFSRSQENPINAALNYGYSLLLSAFNKEIAAAGYLTQIGIYHDNMFNPFNLASDMMEPFRPLVDETVLKLQPTELDKDTKYELLNVLNRKVEIDREEHFAANAIKIYTRGVLEAMNERSVEPLRFYAPCPEKRKGGRGAPVPYGDGAPSAMQQRIDRALTGHTKGREER